MEVSVAQPKHRLLFDPRVVFIVDVKTIYQRAAEKVHDGASQRQVKEQLDLIPPALSLCRPRLVTVVPCSGLGPAFHPSLSARRRSQHGRP